MSNCRHHPPLSCIATHHPSSSSSYSTTMPGGDSQQWSLPACRRHSLRSIPPRKIEANDKDKSWFQGRTLWWPFYGNEKQGEVDAGADNKNNERLVIAKRTRTTIGWQCNVRIRHERGRQWQTRTGCTGWWRWKAACLGIKGVSCQQMSIA